MTGIYDLIIDICYQNHEQKGNLFGIHNMLDYWKMIKFKKMWTINISFKVEQ